VCSGWRWQSFRRLNPKRYPPCLGTSPSRRRRPDHQPSDGVFVERPGSRAPPLPAFRIFNVRGKKQIEGAPFWICEKKFPLERKVTLTLVPCLSRTAPITRPWQISDPRQRRADFPPWARIPPWAKMAEYHERGMAWNTCAMRFHESRVNSQIILQSICEPPRPFHRLYRSSFAAVGGNDGGDVLLAIARDLREQPAEFKSPHTSINWLRPLISKISRRVRCPRNSASRKTGRRSSLSTRDGGLQVSPT